MDEAFSSFEVQASVNVGAVAAGGSSAFTLSLPEELPDDLFFPDEESPEMEVAAFMVGAYIDADGDGDGRWSGNVYTEGVIASSDAVEPSERITVLYMRATGFEAGLLADLFGGMGWTLFQDGETPDDSPIPVSWSDGLVLDDRWE